jgi:biotin carboxylase
MQPPNRQAILFVGRPPYHLSFDRAIDPEQRYRKILLQDPAQGSQSVPGFDCLVSAKLNDRRELEETATQLKRQFDVTLVLNGSEDSVLAAAFLAECLGVNDIGYRTALLTRNKLLMSEALHAHGVNAPKFALHTRDGDVGQVIERLGFPLICKPLMGFASQGVIRADNEEQLRRALNNIRLENKFAMRRYYENEQEIGQVLLQQFIPGSEYALDGFVQEGRVTVLALADKPNVSQGPYFEDRLHVLPAKVDTAFARRIEDIAAQAVEAVGLNNSPFHIEMRHHQGQLFVLEIAARVGFINMLQLLHKLNAYELMFALKNGQTPRLSLSPHHAGSYCIAPNRRGRFKGIANLDRLLTLPHIRQFITLATPDASVAPPPNGNSYIGIAYAVAEHYDGVEQALNRFAREIEVVIN